MIRRLIAGARTVAIVGMSADPQKASAFVASYLQHEGYRIVPVNPRGGRVLGETIYPDLASIPIPIDIVDVFRPPSRPPASLGRPRRSARARSGSSSGSSTSRPRRLPRPPGSRS